MKTIGQLRNYNRLKQTEYRRKKGILPRFDGIYKGKKICLDCKARLKSRSKSTLRCFRCSRKCLSGEKNPFWKGGITAFQKAIRNSLKYKNWRIAVFKRDDFVCQNCFKRGGDLEAHHKIFFISILRAVVPNYKSLNGIQVKNIVYEYGPLWEISNGVTLCKGCHKKTHTNS